MTREKAIALLKALKNGLHETGKDFPYRDEVIPPSKEALDMAIKTLEQEPRKGHWCPQNDDYFDWYECSECGYGSEGEMQYSSEHDVRTNFCPNCGADMREGEE